MQSLGLVSTLNAKEGCQPVIGEILKYLHTLVVFTIFSYIQLIFNRVSLQACGPITDFLLKKGKTKKQVTSLAGRHFSDKEACAHQGMQKPLFTGDLKILLRCCPLPIVNFCSHYQTHYVN